MDGIDNPILEKIVIFSLLVLPIINWIIVPFLTEWAVTAPPTQIILMQIVLTPAYVFLLWLSYEKWGIKGFIAAFSVILSSEIINIPQAIPSPLFGTNVTYPQDHQLYLTADLAMYNIVTHNSHVVDPVMHFITWVVIPTLLGFAALVLVGIDIISKIWGGG